MKNLIFRLFNLFMAVLVLTTATGFGLVEHSCLIRNKTVSLYQKNPTSSLCKACQAKQKALSKETALKKGKCCQETSSYQNVNYSSSLVQYAVKFMKMAFKAILQAFVQLVEAIGKAILTVFSHLFAIAHALLAGKNLLIFIQVFQI